MLDDDFVADGNVMYEYDYDYKKHQQSTAIII